ncbi:PHP domain-containing protein [Curtobacterium ammoniigenes]|uniref:PHP domain-containing protein n=1 Tax=Curtobacterium ammoniigenes TaxID=395387 RepID=UPI0008360370|nr:PHP domain-containing protein [Curtobacterium ammoniigenes]
MDAHAALSEIAFWLERDLAPAFKVRAFRTAAGAIAGLDPAHLEARVASGTIERVKGVGSRSAEVIAEALQNRVPQYLVTLRANRREPMPDGLTSARALARTARIRGDLHTHTEWSDGTTSLESMVEAAAALGREWIAITDHSEGLSIANGLSPDRRSEQISQIADVDEARNDIAVLRGIEVDILEDGSLDGSETLLDALDIVVASVHSKLRAPADAITARMLGAIEDPHVNVLAHCTGRLVAGARAPRPQSAFDAPAVFEACAEAGVAVEINSRPERQDPPDDLVELALDIGCLFSVDSDAHAPGHLDFVRDGMARAADLGVPAERIVTTWPLDEVRTWAARRR